MTEIEQLREEVAKLRERVAILETRTKPYQPIPIPGLPWNTGAHPAPVFVKPYLPFPPDTIICGGVTADLTQNAQ